MGSEIDTKGRGSFSRLGFVLAAAGSAVGLGNIWKFPYITYENQGGTFVLVYLGAIALVGAPIMLAEILIGRRGQSSPVGSFLRLAKEGIGAKAWALVGWLGLLAGLVILSYYSVVAGWTVYYFGKCLAWSFTGFTETDAANLGRDFGVFLEDGRLQVTFHGLFMLATMGVVSLGVKEGIERAIRVLMPVLSVMLVILFVDAVFTPGFASAMKFLFHAGPVSADTILEALGQAFFTLSLGMGAMLTYGSYLSHNDSIPKAGLMVVIFDTVIALIACVIMFSIIFSVPEDQRAETFTESAAILFTTLPRMLYELPFGVILAPLFYLLVGFAALSSTISLLEVVVAYFIDQRGLSRKKAVGVVGGAIFLLGIPSALSLGASTGLTEIKLLGRTGFFEAMDYLASNWLLPLGGLFIALFAGWVLPAAVSKQGLEEGHGAIRWHVAWIWSLRVVAPLAIAWIIVEVIAGRTF